MTGRAFAEGTWIAVPLRAGGYGLGRIARAGKTGILFGYFFGPARVGVPRVEELVCTPAEAIFRCRFSDLDLLEGRWPVLGPDKEWRREEWPMPDFGQGLSTGPRWLVRYRDDDPGEELRVRSIGREEWLGLPRGGMYGSGAVEIVLSRLLGQDIPVPDRSRATAVRRGSWAQSQGMVAIDHFLYFALGARAREAGERLQLLGYRVDLEDQEATWRVRASRFIRPAEEALAASEEEMEAVCRDFGGEYDGFERTVRGWAVDA